jgi:uncharacterized protein DUF3592
MGVFGFVDRLLGKLVFGAIGTVFLGAGCLCLYWGIGELLEANDARGWPSSAGRIVESYESGEAPHITYEYPVEGETLQSTRLFIGEYKGIESHAKALVAEYPEGAAVPVFFNPEEPTASVLQHRFPWTNLILCLMGCGFLGGAWLCYRTKHGFARVVAGVLDAE